MQKGLKFKKNSGFSIFKPSCLEVNFQGLSYDSLVAKFHELVVTS